MTESFIGITAMFLLPDGLRHRVALAVRSFPGRHTHDRIVEFVDAVIQQWSINPRAIFTIVTDNGSNFVAAFREVHQELTEAEETEDVEFAVEELEQNDESQLLNGK